MSYMRFRSVVDVTKKCHKLEYILQTKSLKSVLSLRSIQEV